MADIFISYRREDSKWAAGRLSDRLQVEFGSQRVFMDTAGIAPGDDFEEMIGAKLERCEVLLAVIGQDWLEHLLSCERAGDRDFVRLEIAEALRRGIRVIPVLIDQTQIPREARLPDDVSALVRKQGIWLQADNFRKDSTSLIESLNAYLAKHEQLVKSTRTLAHDDAKIVTDIEDNTIKSLSLTHKTEFWKPGKDGRPRWKIFVSLDVKPISGLPAVDRVIYYLHPTFKNPVREILDRKTHFELKTSGWGQFVISAEVFLTGHEEPVRLTRFIDFTPVS